MTLIDQINQMSSEELDAYNKAMTKTIIIRTAVMLTVTVVVNVGAGLLVRHFVKAPEIKTS